MKILSLDPVGVNLDWCMQCIAAGHEVRSWVGPHKQDGKRSDVQDGIVTRVDNWRAQMGWADLIFMADNAYEREGLESFFKRGFPIFGAHMAAGDFELSRQKGQDVFKKVGFKVMGGTEFKDYDAAIKFVKAHPDTRWVSKPDGDKDKALSFVSSNQAEMLFMLDYWKKTVHDVDRFILQEFCPGVAELAVGGWFGKNGWVGTWCENWEFKKVYSGDIGPNCGEAGTVLKYVKDSKLAGEMLVPLTDVLKKMNYRGYVDVATIIDEKGTPRPLEFTTRPGWPCFIIQGALHRGDPAEWMVDALEGRDTLEHVDEIAVGVVIGFGDFPYGGMARKDLAGFPIGAPEDEIGSNIHLCDAKMASAPHDADGETVYGPTLVTCGDYTAVCTGTAYGVKDAAARAYRSVKKLKVMGSPHWRNDIGNRLEKQLPKVQEHGYCEEWEF